VTFAVWLAPRLGARAAIISEATRSLTAVATEPTVLAVIDEKTFLYLVHETPMFAIQVMRSMADRIRELDPQL